MLIISKTANESGAYSSPQNWDSETTPDGYYTIADGVDLSEMYKNGGFVMLTVENDIVTGFTVNSDAWEAWKTANPDKSEREAKITELKEHLVSTDYKVIKCSECSLAGLDAPYDIAELNKERQAIRDQINALEGKS